MAYCSDSGFNSTVLAIQTYGGYGFCSEYPVEQYARDCKIASIYEGTNGIQALDLLGRKLAAKGGMLVMSFIMELNSFIAKSKGHEALGEYVGLLDEAKNAMAGTVMEFICSRRSAALSTPSCAAYAPRSNRSARR